MPGHRKVGQIHHPSSGAVRVSANTIGHGFVLAPKEIPNAKTWGLALLAATYAQDDRIEAHSQVGPCRNF